VGNEWQLCCFVDEPTMFKPVDLKREPRGSLRKEFLICGRKYVPGSNWGGKAVDEKTLSFYY